MPDLDLDLRLEQDGFELAVSRSLRLEGVTALFGASGSGKTTLLRVVAGLESQAEGRVTFAGTNWQEPAGRFVPPHRRGVGVVFQDTRLFAHLSVGGNLHFAERRARRDGIRFNDVVEALDLGPLLDREVQTLSGGEAQRVAIGRTLLARPNLLLMDEPLAALDLQRKAELIPYIERLPGGFDVPIVFVTHALDEVARLADRMVVLADGRVITAGITADILERLDLLPLTGEFEAGVVLAGEVTAQDARYALTTIAVAGQHLVIPALELPIGAPVRLRVRARDVALARDRPHGTSIRNILAAQVLEISEQDSTAFAEVLLALDGVHLRARVTRASVADLSLTAGDRIFALVKSIAVDRGLIGGDV